VNKYLIYTVLIVLGTLIVYIILNDALKDSINKEKTYSYGLEDFKKVDPSLIKYKEVKRIRAALSKPKALAYFNGYLGIAYDNQLQVIDTTGQEYINRAIRDTITSISFAPDGRIFLGCGNQVFVYDMENDKLDKWKMIGPASYITSIVFKENTIFIADVDGPRVHRFNNNGEKLNSFDGKGRIERDVGFVIPSPYFDLAIGPDDQLWVANTGLQSIENYEDNGELRSYWGEPSYKLDGFVGCCNPAQFAILSDGSFVTCEKGIVRIKVYHPSGQLESVVAPPNDFNLTSEPADLAVDENDGIYALDVSRKIIRKFERITDG